MVSAADVRKIIAEKLGDFSGSKKVNSGRIEKPGVGRPPLSREMISLIPGDKLPRKSKFVVLTKIEKKARKKELRILRKIRRMKNDLLKEVMGPVKIPDGLVGMPAEMYAREREAENAEIRQEMIQDRLAPPPPAPGELKALREEFVDGKPFAENLKFWQYGPNERPRYHEKDRIHLDTRHRASSPWGRKGREKARRWLRLQELERMMR